MFVKMLIVLILGMQPALAINKCTSKYSIGYQQFPCPETAIKSEVYIDKVGAPARNPMPRYTEKSNAKKKMSTSVKKSKAALKSASEPSAEDASDE